MDFEKLGKFGTLFKIIGMLLVARKIAGGLIGIYKAFLRRRKNLVQRYGKNTWALVTGASDGIGQEFCRQLAKIGFNVILVARTQKKLEETAEELKKINPNISTKVVPADLSKANDEGWVENIYEQVKDLDVSILINNAGIDVFERFELIDPEYLKKMISINCTALYLLNHKFVPQMAKRSKKSAVINVSSGVVKVPLAYYSPYNGTKALVDYFTLSLGDEFKNIDFMSMQPYDVSTAMMNNRPPDVMTITRQECVKGFLDCLGYEKQSVGHWKHRLQDYLYSLLPRWLINLVFFNFVMEDFFKERIPLVHNWRLKGATAVNAVGQDTQKETKKTE